MPIPVVRPSHCPRTRISNAASPRQVIYTKHLNTFIVYKRCWDIIHPHRRSVALPLCTDSKLRSLTTQNSNVRKRLPETDLTTGSPGLVPIDMSWPIQPFQFLNHIGWPKLTNRVGGKVSNKKWNFQILPKLFYLYRHYIYVSPSISFLLQGLCCCPDWLHDRASKTAFRKTQRLVWVRF